MKIAILSLKSRFGDKTGDMVQASKTADAIRGLGHDVLRCYFLPDTGEVFDCNGKPYGGWTQALGDRDIVHAIPPIPWQFLRRQPMIKAKFVCSTVFWRSFTYTRVMHKVFGRCDSSMVKEYCRTFAAYFGIPTYSSYIGYDLLLPNSEDEQVCFSRYCRIKRGAKIVAVPNAIDPLPSDVEVLPRFALVPERDYVLVPGVFAARKNQLSLIKAMKGCDFPIVFIGDGPMLDRCKKEATANMTFIGYVAHGSKEFYAIMKHARVVCLPSNCETPGIAGLEAAALGARPVVPYEGGTIQYYGWDAEYLNPLSNISIRNSIEKAWRRGRLPLEDRGKYMRLDWQLCAERTIAAYLECF